ncbi:O-antigen ligase family protein [uncultured Rheinheimera sp.]|uniref:O-antigen ligase family protein n=1 Tax=uncultured Rheinheimera sp. TaxID=400532 RepID=UPI002596910F|nr:O-antigen ligase family protein [uncultured Rheinheimera sp.]
MRLSSYFQQVQALDKLILLLCSCYLLIDACNGFLLNQFGRSFGLSALYKVLMLVLMLVSLSWRSGKTFLLFPALFILLLPGAFYSWLHLGGSLAPDLGLILKLISPLIAFYYLLSISQLDKHFALKFLHQVFVVNYLIVLVNFIFGALGYGYTSYLPQQHLSQVDLGSKGFFNAANELSVVLLVLSAWLLQYYWQQHKLIFLAVAATSIWCASLMLTKTGMLGTLILVLFIPLMPWFIRLNWNRLALATLLLVVVAALVIWQAPLLLGQLGLAEKLQHVYQQQGLLGVLLSSRDKYAAEIWQLVSFYYSDVHRLFGVGLIGVSEHLWKFWAESDPFDLYIFYGVAGLMFFSWVFIGFIAQNLKLCRLYSSELAATLVLLNLLLLMVACIAGHVISSGMLWPVWGFINAAALIHGQSQATPKKTELAHVTQ